MAQEVFVDAGFWIALFTPRDEHHIEALVAWREVTSNHWRSVTTNWTLYEALTFLSCSLGRHDRAIEAFDFVSQLSEIVRIEHAQLEDRSLEIFRSHSDKRWSLVDCANFACIEHRRSELALYYDNDFQQARAEFGFNRWMTR